MANPSHLEAVNPVVEVFTMFIIFSLSLFFSLAFSPTEFIAALASLIFPCYHLCLVGQSKSRARLSQRHRAETCSTHSPTRRCLFRWPGRRSRDPFSQWPGGLHYRWHHSYCGQQSGGLYHRPSLLALHGLLHRCCQVCGRPHSSCERRRRRSCGALLPFGSRLSPEVWS